MAESSGPPPLDRVVRLFRLVDGVCALFLIGFVVERVLSRTDLFVPIPADANLERRVGFMAHYALPSVMALLSLALLVLVVFPRRRPRHLAFAALGVAVLGFLLLACSLAVPWAANLGIGPLVIGGGLIAVGVAAHLGLARWLWRAATPAP